ncbi:hypothetical protein Y032_0037g3497 [Ancylostoma ceylanicum]|uniref:Uncharacterized protein n=1 Tax=Ancylostoma ceylanicum TaxID=53326 RepID=A0A016ULJ6_9BILA|nr:hypothetical protein Y032_0037g3497 [Ancylostoma ceylanicum]
MTTGNYRLPLPSLVETVAHRKEQEFEKNMKNKPTSGTVTVSTALQGIPNVEGSTRGNPRLVDDVRVVKCRLTTS